MSPVWNTTPCAAAHALMSLSGTVCVVQAEVGSSQDQRPRWGSSQHSRSYGRAAPSFS